MTGKSQARINNDTYNVDAFVKSAIFLTVIISCNRHNKACHDFQEKDHNS